MADIGNIGPVNSVWYNKDMGKIKAIVKDKNEQSKREHRKEKSPGKIDDKHPHIDDYA